MAFLLPAKYSTVAAAPVPEDAAVQLRQLPSRTQAVATFSWRLTEASVATHLAALVANVESDPEWEPVLTAAGQPEWCAAGYNPPFCIPFLRTNEVMLTVRPREAGTC